MDAPVTALCLAAKAGAGPERWLEPPTILADLLRLARQDRDREALRWATERVDATDYSDFKRWCAEVSCLSPFRSIDYVPAPTWTELPLDPRR